MEEPAAQPAAPGVGNDQPGALRHALEDFVYDNAELERLEAILDTFNPFVAVRWTRQEARHSASLRWLLDPSETHGLGDYFLSQFLKRAVRRSPGGRPSVVEVDSWDLSHAAVHQEWRGIDVLVQDDINRLVVVIENKIESAEHSHQLQRYRAEVERHFPQHSRVFVYLTPGLEPPSDESYASMSYSDVVGMLDVTLDRRREQVRDEVATFLRQYADMVRRHIVEDSEIQELCRTIYEKHRRALDVLFEFRPDRAAEVSAALMDLLKTQAHITIDRCGKSYLDFTTTTLDFIPKVGAGWTRSGRLLLFELQNVGGQVRFALTLGPGEQPIRDRLHETIQAHPKVFNRATRPLSQQYWTCHIECWITPKQYEELDLDALREECRRRLDHFVTDHLPAIEQALLPLQREWPLG